MPLLALLPIAALAGMATALSPCVLPVLPLVLGASAGGGRLRPLGVVTGLVLGFTALVLLGAALVSALGLPPMALRLLAAAIIALGGLALLVPAFGERLTVALERLLGRLTAPLAGAAAGVGASRRFTPTGSSVNASALQPFTTTSLGDYAVGLVVGVGVGLAWTPCAGPVLAAVAALAATQGPTPTAAALTLAYAAGHAVPLLAVAYGGQRLGGGWAARGSAARAARQAFGLVLAAAALLVGTGMDQSVQSSLARIGPAGIGAWLARAEQSPVVQGALDRVLRTGGPPSTAELARALAAAASPAAEERGARLPSLAPLGPAPELTGITAWFNGPPLRPPDLRGRVVLIDFWTYTCINCLRTLPYLKAWDARYREAGLTIVGVHTPEFAFEGVPANVAAAIAREGIRYPVALDKDYATWRAYRNRFWPAKYLIDATGQLRYVHFGEGAYEETEAAIRALLAEAGHPLPAGSGERVETELASSVTTPETYLGFDRLERQRFASPQPVARGFAQLYTAPPWHAMPAHAVALDGRWTVREEAAESGPDAALLLRFYASTVNLVLTPPSDIRGQGSGVRGQADAAMRRRGDAATEIASGSESDTSASPQFLAPGSYGVTRVRVWLDGEPIAARDAGADIRDSVVVVDAPRMYRLVDLRGQSDAHTLRLMFETPGMQAFAFTFG